MTGVWQSILLVGILSAEGGASRLLYSHLLRFQKKWGNRLVNCVCDVLFVVICGGAVFVTCFLLANEVRVFYVLGYLLGGIITHLCLSILARQRKSPKKE